MNLLDLFSGIGAFSLGLERSGAFRAVAFCESDPFCRRVLAKHWPEVPCYDDVRTLTAARLATDGISVDVICGGWPCQPHSVAGARAASSDSRDLWPEFFRLVREIRPRWVVGENVPGLLSSESGRFFGRILRDLASIGFDAEWQVISAADMGAPHRRERVWIVAYPGGEGRREVVRGAYGDEGADGPQHLLVAGGNGTQRDVADAICAGLEGRAGFVGHDADERASVERGGALRDAGRLPPSRHRRIVGPIGQSDWWLVEPDVCRVVDGCPARVDRLRSLGNSLIPQIPEAIGRAIAASAVSRTAQRRPA